MVRTQQWVRTLTWVVAATLAWTLLGAGQARAADDDAKIAVKIEGSGASTIRERILDIVPEGIEVIEDSEFRVALAQSGLPGGRMAHAVTSARMRRPLLKIVRRAVARRGLNGAIIGRTKGGRRGYELVLIYQEEEGEPLVDTTVPLSGGAAAQEEALSAALAVVFEAIAPAPEEEPEEEIEEVEEEIEEDDEEEDDEEEGEPFDENRPGSELFGLEVGFGLSGRFFSYGESDQNTNNLRPYETFGTPSLLLGGELYPAATTDVTFLKDLGVTLHYLQPFGLGSRSEDAQYTFDTSWTKLWVGLAYRIRIGDADDLPPVIFLSGRFGIHNFVLEPADAASEAIADELPTAEYQLMRIGLDARFPIGEHFALLPGIGYAAPLAGGTLYDRIQGASLAGVDASLLFAIPIDLGFELRFGGDYTGIFSTFEAAPGDTFVAESAADHFLTLSLGMAYLY
ncbi:MAG: hypothetical protein JRI23_19355 [Deltaproteobacteria bacterium]|jgi:hypothetical protein|nr:hypothetical protein [Deltaproteobacteria bacterium]MBW2534022.1 hypothetical protein [Deltaproteobacteria bacterium]